MPLRRAFTLLLALAMLAGCSTNPATGRRQYIALSASQVTAMGVQATPGLIEEYGGEVKSAELRAYVAEIGGRVAAHVEPEYADVTWTFYVLDSDVINAFALPGGNVFITRGLLERFDNEAQVAGVLGHEIGHVTGRHVDERLSQAVTAEIGLGVLGAVSDEEIINVGVGALVQVGMLSFSRDQERESDALGVRYMTLASYDPQGMVQVLEVLAAAAGGAAPPEFLSTHPHPESRISDIRALVSRDYAYTQGDASYRLDRERFDSRARPYLTARGGS